MAPGTLDSLAWTYIGFAIIWTVALVAGMAFLYHHRHLPFLRIRRLPLVFLGLSFLHAYGFLCAIAYVIAPFLPCDAEFWMMSLYLPFGMAMFHATNTQFLHVASRQKLYAQIPSRKRPSMDEEEAERLANSRVKRIFRGVERADRVGRTMAWIGVGLTIQVFILSA